MIKKKTIDIHFEKTIKEAFYKKSGDDRIFVPAVKEPAIEKRIVYTVNIGNEEHQFSTEKEAREFLA